MASRGRDEAGGMTSHELRSHLLSLTAQRAAASFEAHDRDGTPPDDLETEIRSTHHALVGAAVTEIASFRAQLSGPQIG